MHRQHRGGVNSAANLAYCVCSACGKAVRHVPGVPCNSRNCPNCGHFTYKSYDAIAPEMIITVQDEDQEDFQHHSPVRQTLYPFINSEKCTACSECIDICPATTIYLKSGKAFVDESNCRNCKVCMTVCPENAFELK